MVNTSGAQRKSNNCYLTVTRKIYSQSRDGHVQVLVSTVNSCSTFHCWWLILWLIPQKVGQELTFGWEKSVPAMASPPSNSRTDSSQSWVWWCTKGKGKVNRCSTLNSVWLSQRHRECVYKRRNGQRSIDFLFTDRSIFAVENRSWFPAAYLLLGCQE